MITRNEATDLLFSYLADHNLRIHCLATAYVLEALAVLLYQPQEEWFLTGYLHDIDLNVINNDMTQHTLKAMELLQPAHLTEEMLHAIRAHNNKVERSTLLDKALWAADPVTGLVIATTLMQPEKKISVVALKSLTKKFKNKNFAAGASREQIASCSELGLDLDSFLSLALQAMASNEASLGF